MSLFSHPEENTSGHSPRADGRIIDRDEWLFFATKLDWRYKYRTEQELFPEIISGHPWLPHEEWRGWQEPFHISYDEYVSTQQEKCATVDAVRTAVGGDKAFGQLPPSWLNAVKFYAATFPLAEFAATVGNLRAARFGRDSAWRNVAVFGALDECRHTQTPLLVMHEFVKLDRQFDWTHRFYHSNDWVAIAARHLTDELILAANPIEFAIGTHFVFETGFTNLQFIALTSMANEVGDKLFEKMLTSIQTDEARHAQVGPAVLKVVVKHDPDYAQYMLDKWFWRSWQFIAILTGFSMDYLTPVAQRTRSFKEFMEEWIDEQFIPSLSAFGLKKPWYWDQFLDAMEIYHHMVYASAYTHRATVWFNMPLPSPDDRAWLQDKYPKSWPMLEPVWNQIDKNWREMGAGMEWGVHGATPVTFCNLCQMVLCGGTPDKNTAQVLEHGGQKYIFCSEPCAWIFKREPERYAAHKDLVKRILAGEVPTNLLEIVTRYFGLTEADWGKDVCGGDYSWLKKESADGESRP